MVTYVSPSLLLCAASISRAIVDPIGGRSGGLEHKRGARRRLRETNYFHIIVVALSVPDLLRRVRPR